MSHPLFTGPVSPGAARRLADFHPEIVKEVAEAVSRDDIVVVGMAQNPFVKKARRALEAAELPFTYLEYGSYFSMWKPRLALKTWSGWPTFPQVFVRGTLLGGHACLEAALASGEVQTLLAGEPERAESQPA